MVSIQQEAILQRVLKQDVRWLRKHVFTLLGEIVSVNKLIDKSNREAYLQEYFANMTTEQVKQLANALTNCAIHKKVSLLIFASVDDIDAVGVKNKMKEMNRDVVQEIACLSSGFGAFITEISQVEKDETAVVYLSDCVADHADDIKVKLSYVIGHLGKDNLVVFCKNCELSEDIRYFIHDAGIICERIWVLGL